MRRENHLPLVSAGAVLSIAILVTFQLYLLREPSRLQRDAAHDRGQTVRAGESIFGSNCAACHGDNGQGGIGPALNSKPLLSTIGDDQLFSLVRTGIPGTAMPAWSQSFGGPLTDEEVRQVVSFVRAWEPNALEASQLGPAPDPHRGLEIFESICFACHGSQGTGTDRAPALNDPTLLNSFDDNWFRDTISQGRPSRGMPTWGTVLSPAEIDDLISLFGYWRTGEPLPVGPNNLTAEQLFIGNCAACHGGEGEGKVGPALVDSAFVSGKSESELVEFISAGRPGTAMPSWQGRLTTEELAAIAGLLLSWQP